MLYEITAILSKSEYRIKMFICAGLIAFVSLEWFIHAWQSASMRTRVETPANAVTYNAREIIAFDQELSEVTDAEDLINRPLFNKTRKVFVAEAETPEVQNVAQNLELDEWALVGTYLKNDEKHALFNNKNIPKKHLKLLLNDTIGSWSLSEITANKVVFEQNQEQRVLELRKAKSGSASAAHIPPHTRNAPKKNDQAKQSLPAPSQAVDATSENFVAPNISEPENNNETE